MLSPCSSQAGAGGLSKIRDDQDEGDRSLPRLWPRHTRRSDSPAPADAEPLPVWDCHCHILPGLDDGPAGMDTALDMVRMASAHGTRAMIATPHAIQGLYGTRRPQVLRALAELRQRCADHGLTVELYPGQEVALTPDLAERLAAGEILTLADAGRALLVELPQSGVPPYWTQAFFRLALDGVTPIVAHAERTPLLGDPELAARMIEHGARLQINARVLRAGGRIRRTVREWLRRDWVACVGSDGHDLGRRPPVLDEAVRERLHVPAIRASLERPGVL